MTVNVALVTGARSGIGLELTRKLLRGGWEVIALLRSPLPQYEDIKSAGMAGQLRCYFADLANFADLGRFHADIKRHESSIDVLFNNAGVNTEKRENSPQGRELHFEMNVLVPYILSRELLPLLKKGRMSRIINTSSNALLSVKHFEPHSLGDPSRFQKLFGPYANSKLALSLWTKAAAPEFAKQGVSLVSTCPGPNRTPMTGGSGMPLLLRPFVPLFFKHPGVGAQKLLKAAVDADLPSGSFIMNGSIRPLPFAERAPEVLTIVDNLHRSIGI
ncbi:NAD-dependent epimerase [Sphingobium sp. SCG-1]|uniref:SDR family NAD(P)-dependent oxidoreductase n=1 Tax=Sphingobium sp. SCG-1 TaxID=2072936 RepID=UPI000CD6C558|nr:SDR family NAD(P)-dependent oxidoreductase [Sphingobium sp. SCG-1]AUW59761.1 NAD-dependent epimerase [Sphingobium sp. SCG-1]